MTKQCFIITPLGALESDERNHADRVWEQVLKPVFEPAGYELIRSDKMGDPGQITDAIFKCIADSDVCVADLSFLNPNVMYELGVRHCLRLSAIQIKSVETQNPFDTKNQRTIDFDVEADESLVALRAEIKKQLTWIERNPGVVSNPLMNAIQRSPAGFEAERTAKELASLARRIAELEDLVRGKGEEVGLETTADGDGNEAALDDLKKAADLDIDGDGIEWEKQQDNSQSARFARFDIALRPQSKGRWSSSAVHSVSGYSVTYPTWRTSADEAKKAIIEAILNEVGNWQRS